MLTLIATCLLAAGATFTPLPAWTITDIRGGGRPDISLLYIHPVACIDKSGNPTVCPEPDRRTIITMQRTLTPGQVAEAPQGCTLQLETKH